MAAVMAAIEVRLPTERGTIRRGKTTSSRSGTRGRRRSAGRGLLSWSGDGWVSSASVLMPSALSELGAPILDRRFAEGTVDGAALERARADDPGDLVLLQDLLPQQRLGQQFQLGPVGRQDALGRLVALAEQPGHLLVDDGGGALADVRVAGQLPPQEDRVG